jgi:Fur family ferric uptake transcriptional regulator
LVGRVPLEGRLKLTKQRKAILDELKSTKSHPTANEVYERVRKRIPNISLGTVYRNLELLARSGMITKLELSGTKKRFDGFTETHYHVQCVRCGRVDDLPMDPVSSLDESVSKLVDYEIFSHRLEFLGLCPRCRRQVARGTDPAGGDGDVDGRAGCKS